MQHCWGRVWLCWEVLPQAVPREFQVSTTPVVMDHVTIETSIPHQMVTSRLNGEVKRFDQSYRTLLNENKIDELRAKLIQGLEPDGFMIHFVAEQGDLPLR